jgi:hypothetical protein
LTPQPRQACLLTVLAAACAFLGELPPASAQTTNFATTTKTVTLPKGTKIDPRYLLRRNPAPADATKPQTPEEKAAQEAQKLADALDAKLLGAWTRVATIKDGITTPKVKEAAKRCLQQLKLKPLKFETKAARQLPDIDALFGDVVYYRTETGLQRLHINSGRVRLISKHTVKDIKNNQQVWTLTGQNLRLRVRFSKSLPKAPKARFMIEESGFYLRCPSNKDDLFNVDQ